MLPRCKLLKTLLILYSQVSCGLHFYTNARTLGVTRHEKQKKRVRDKQSFWSFLYSLLLIFTNGKNNVACGCIVSNQTCVHFN